MSFLALLMWAVMSGQTVIQYGNQPLDMGLVEQSSTPHIQHLWFSQEDKRQLMVQKAYDLWWMDFVVMLECENGNRDINAIWDWGKAHWLCQMNTRWHKLPQEYYNSWEYQIDYCYNKRKSWTKFYAPTRKIKGQLCKNYVLDRFVIK